VAILSASHRPLPERARNARRLELSWIAFLTTGVLAAIILAAPTVVVLINSFNAASYLTFPPQGYSLRWYEALLEDGTLLRSAWLSLVIALLVTAIDLAIGVPAALALARGNFRGRQAIMAFVLSPLMIPQIVIGYALLVYFSRLSVPLGMNTLVLGHIIVSAPYIVRIVGGGAERLDRTLEEAAANLGAAPAAVFRRVTLPALAPAIAAGAAFAFLASFDNLEASIFLAVGRIQTLPVKLFSLLLFDTNPIVGAVATLQIIFALALFVVLERLLGIGQLAVLPSRQRTQP
jgi:putative spermidine/putrescine transport system permease protein